MLFFPVQRVIVPTAGALCATQKATRTRTGASCNAETRGLLTMASVGAQQVRISSIVF